MDELFTTVELAGGGPVTTACLSSPASLLLPLFSCPLLGVSLSRLHLGLQHLSVSHLWLQHLLDSSGQVPLQVNLQVPVHNSNQPN